MDRWCGVAASSLIPRLRPDRGISQWSRTMLRHFALSADGPVPGHSRNVNEYFELGGSDPGRDGFGSLAHALLEDPMRARTWRAAIRISPKSKEVAMFGSPKLVRVLVTHRPSSAGWTQQRSRKAQAHQPANPYRQSIGPHQTFLPESLEIASPHLRRELLHGVAQHGFRHRAGVRLEKSDESLRILLSRLA